MRMSFTPRPAESVHRNRPFRVRPPPAGALPSLVSFPAGWSLRPLGWILSWGPIRPLGTEAAIAAPAPASVATATAI